MLKTNKIDSELRNDSKCFYLYEGAKLHVQ